MSVVQECFKRTEACNRREQSWDYGSFEVFILHIRDLKPGMSSVNIKVTVTEISEPKQIITSKWVNHEILEAKVEDETGAITLVL